MLIKIDDASKWANADRKKIDEKSWVSLDKIGEFAWIDKEHLRVETDYQRESTTAKVQGIARAWSWPSCGALVVGRRPDGTLVVMDGAHRLSAAMRRADVQQLPCMIFDVRSVAAEAASFVSVNTARKPMAAIDVHRAAVVAGVEKSVAIQRLCDEIGIEIAATGKKNVLSAKSIALLTELLRQRPVRFPYVLSFVAGMYARRENKCLSDRVIATADFLDRRISEGLDDRRLRERIESVGVDGIVRACRVSTELHGKGGVNVWSLGVLVEINKGLRNKFAFNAEQDTPSRAG